MCQLNYIFALLGLVLTKDMQTPSPPPRKSGHLDIKDVQCAENKDGRKTSYYIISRLGVAFQKGCFGRPKIQVFFFKK